MLDCHESQFYEWLPFNRASSDIVPSDRMAQKAWLAEQFRERVSPLADRFRDSAIESYGLELGANIRYIEAFEISEYGSPLSCDDRQMFFPFMNGPASAITEPQ
jgi:hypothetical protein